MYLISAERYDDALAAYQELVNDDPTDADSYLRMSQIYRQKKDLVKGARSFRQSQGHRSEQHPGQAERGVHSAGRGQTGRGHRRSCRAFSSKPKSRTYDPAQLDGRIELLEQLAVMQRLADQTQPAVDSYRQIAALDPSKAPHASASIIDTYMGGKEFSKAQEEADAAIKKFPNDREVRVEPRVAAGRNGQDRCGRGGCKEAAGRKERPRAFS